MTVIYCVYYNYNYERRRADVQLRKTNRQKMKIYDKKKGKANELY